MPPLRSRICGAQRSSCLLIVALAGVSLLGSPASAARFMSWNTLNFPGSTSAIREPEFRAVITAVNPDLLVTEEIRDTVGALQFRDNVLEVAQPGEWTMAQFTLSNDSERALYYKSSAFSELAHGQITTALRTIEWWRMSPVGYSSSAADLYVFVVHLKASTGSTNEAKRFAEVQILRNYLETLPPNSNFVVAGDFNLYDSGEPAWAELTGSQANNSGQLFDPINRVGSWHDNPAFADIHTQSTRTVSLGDGGATGGMDDRFDFVLANDDLLDNEGLDLLESTYKAFGQDGLHFNSDLNAAPTNAAVGQALANSLRRASDHLPVVVDLQLPAQLALSGSLAMGQVLVGTPAQATMTVSNPAPGGSDELDATVATSAPFAAFPLTFQVNAGGSSSVSIVADSSVEGNYAGSVQVNSDAVDLSDQALPVSVTVVSPSLPSFDAALEVTASNADFGQHPVGQFSNLGVQVFNASSAALPAKLEIYAAQLTGPDASRFAVLGFAPTLVGAAPESATVNLGFDDSGATGGTTYTATLSLSTRDDPSVSGSQNRTTLTVELTATVEAVGTPAPSAPLGITRLLPNVPNPFNPRTTLRFELSDPSSVRLEVFDLRGRVVRTLVDRSMRAGTHSVVWEGRDDRGSRVASATYVVRMSAGGQLFTQRISLVR